MWVIFDLNGTLVDPSVLLEPGDLGVTALDEANMMAMVTVLAGRETTFKPLLDAALRRGLERAGLDPGLAEGALERLPDMPAYPDVPDALAASARGRLPARGPDPVGGRRRRGGARPTSGLREHFELVLSAPASGAFKPEDLAYRYALDQAGATDAWFVAGHWWDVAGAAYAGLRTAWISRTDLAYPVAMPEPDVTRPGSRLRRVPDPQRRLNGAPYLPFGRGRGAQRSAYKPGQAVTVRRVSVWVRERLLPAGGPE